MTLRRWIHTHSKFTLPEVLTAEVILVVGLLGLPIPHLVTLKGKPTAEK